MNKIFAFKWAGLFAIAALMVGPTINANAQEAAEQAAPATAEPAAEATVVAPAVEPGEPEAQPQADAQPQPEPEIEVLKVTVRAVQGMVHYRANSEDDWKPATEGLVLDAGAEFRTGLRSAVQFSIPPDQVITLDRLGTVKVLNAIRQGDTVKSDLGMRYGRTSYEVEGAGIEHDATIRSPSATLAVRGTDRIVLTDQGPFPAYASTRQSRSFFHGRGRQEIAFGSESSGERGFSEHNNGPADEALENQTNIPGLRLALTEAEFELFQQLRTNLIGSTGGLLDNLQNDFTEHQLYESLHGGEYQPPTEPTGPFTALPLFIGFEFMPFSQSDPAPNINTTITTPTGEVLSAAGDTDAFNGVYHNQLDGNFRYTGATWGEMFGDGTYQIDLQWTSGGPETTYNMVVTQDASIVYLIEEGYIGSDVPSDTIFITLPSAPLFPTNPTPQ